MSSGACRATETEANELKQAIENSAFIGTHDHGTAHGDLPRTWGLSGKERLFPALRDVYAEGPCARHAWFMAAELAGNFVHGGIHRVAVNGRCTGIQP